MAEWDNQCPRAGYQPGGVSLGVEVEASVGLHHGVLDSCVRGPDQGQHPPHTSQRVGHAELAHRHAELHCLQNH